MVQQSSNAQPTAGKRESLAGGRPGPYGGLLESVRAHTPAADPAQATEMVDAVLAALGQSMLSADRRALAGMVSLPIARALRRDEAMGSLDLEAIFERVGERLGVGVGQARGIVLAVTQGLGRFLDEGTLKAFRGRLPDDVAAMLTPSERTEARALRGPGTRGVAGRDRGWTLATGRPGSGHPLSEASPAQHDSIAVNPSPRSGRKLSSSDGTPSLGHSLATGRPGSGRPISEAGDE